MALVTASGMSAITCALLSVLSAGDHVLVQVGGGMRQARAGPKAVRTGAGLMR